jgi:hypothetical protein
MTYAKVQDWVVAPKAPPMPQRGTRRHFDQIVHDSAQGLGIDPKRVTWREIGAGLIEVAVSSGTLDETKQLHGYLRDQMSLAITVSVVGMKMVKVPAAWDAKAFDCLKGKSVGGDTGIKPALPKWHAFRHETGTWGYSHSAILCSDDTNAIGSLGSFGELTRNKDFALVPWQWAAEHEARDQHPERVPYVAGTNAIQIEDLARAVSLDPSTATREQCMARIDALMTEPLTITQRALDRASDAINLAEDRGRKLESALDELAIERTRTEQLNAALGTAQHAIHTLSRKGSK